MSERLNVRYRAAVWYEMWSTNSDPDSANVRYVDECCRNNVSVRVCAANLILIQREIEQGK